MWVGGKAASPTYPLVLLATRRKSSRGLTTTQRNTHTKYAHKHTHVRKGNHSQEAPQAQRQALTADLPAGMWPLSSRLRTTANERNVVECQANRLQTSR